MSKLVELDIKKISNIKSMINNRKNKVDTKMVDREIKILSKKRDIVNHKISILESKRESILQSQSELNVILEDFNDVKELEDIIAEYEASKHIEATGNGTVEVIGEIVNNED